jgi:hypothetical protein
MQRFVNLATLPENICCYTKTPKPLKTCNLLDAFKRKSALGFMLWLAMSRNGTKAKMSSLILQGTNAGLGAVLEKTTLQ